ncbi:MAG: hypothetical protein IPK74_32770 [Deltaproteobacteria bacterium]|nr:hypothetical protein [Deltaproteobacteria bacterium]
MQLPAAMIERLRTGVGAAALLTASLGVDAGCATRADAASGPGPAAFAGMAARDNPTARPAPRVASHPSTPESVAPSAWPSAQSGPPIAATGQPIAVTPQPIAAPEPGPSWECGPCGRG